jgi:hypothetical protein
MGRHTVTNRNPDFQHKDTKLTKKNSPVDFGFWSKLRELGVEKAAEFAKQYSLLRFTPIDAD